MAVRGVDHVDLRVRSIVESTAAFEKLGFKVIGGNPQAGGVVKLQIPGPGQVIFELHQCKEGQEPGVYHLAFVVDNLEKDHAELAAKGFPVPAELRVRASGRLFDVPGPDGYPWRFNEAGAE